MERPYNHESRVRAELGGPQNFRLAVTKRLCLEGFIVSGHFDMMPHFFERMAGWIAEGAVRVHQTVEHGIENAPAAFIRNVP